MDPLEEPVPHLRRLGRLSIATIIESPPESPHRPTVLYEPYFLDFNNLVAVFEVARRNVNIWTTTSEIVPVSRTGNLAARHLVVVDAKGRRTGIGRLRMPLE